MIWQICSGVNFGGAPGLGASANRLATLTSCSGTLANCSQRLRQWPGVSSSHSAPEQSASCCTRRPPAAQCARATPIVGQSYTRAPSVPDPRAPVHSAPLSEVSVWPSSIPVKSSCLILPGARTSPVALSPGSIPPTCTRPAPRKINAGRTVREHLVVTGAASALDSALPPRPSMLSRARTGSATTPVLARPVRVALHLERAEHDLGSNCPGWAFIWWCGDHQRRDG